MPATTITSAWRGLKRATSAPKRAMSNLLDAAAMNSMAQHDSPRGSGHSEFLRAQLISESAWVTKKPPSSLRPVSACFSGIISSVRWAPPAGALTFS